jgi:copper oxidase (laccase) domain-containing protein
MVLGADCPLVCLFDPLQPAVALLHAGWRGLRAGVLRRGMEALGPGNASHVQAFLGACAGPCCYEVGEELAARFPEDTVRKCANVHLDLPAAVARELGIPVTRVGPECTICDDRVFSHRAEKTPNRHALAAMLTGDRNP